MINSLSLLSMLDLIQVCISVCVRFLLLYIALAFNLVVSIFTEFGYSTREACEEYTQEMMKLSFKLLELIALSLSIPADRLSDCFKDHTSFVRINYYPPCPFPDLALGVGPHKDSGALTVLAQDDVGGLEVKRKTDGAWILVKPIPDAYIINVGDVIQVSSFFLPEFNELEGLKK